MQTPPTQAFTHTNPEEGGLVLCADCGAEAINAGESHPFTHSELQPNWTFAITRDHPVYCDNCCAPVIAADTP